MEPCPGPLLKGWLKDAGFVDVVAERHILPVGTWPLDPHLVNRIPPANHLCPTDSPLQKEVGAWNYLQITEGLEASFYALFTRFLDYSQREVDVVCAKIRGELKDPSMHAFFYL